MSNLAIQYNNLFLFQATNYMNVVAIAAIIVFLMAAKNLKEAVNGTIFQTLLTIVPLLYSLGAIAVNFYMRGEFMDLVSKDLEKTGLISLQTQDFFYFYSNLQAWICVFSSLFNLAFLTTRRKIQ